MEEQTEIDEVISWIYGTKSKWKKAQTLSNDWNPHYLHQSISFANHEDSVKQQTKAH